MNRLTYNVLIENYLKADPVNLMAWHGKSFYFASLIFSKERLYKIATLYKLCRFIDDCADELSSDESKYAINKIISELDDPKDESELNSLISQVQSFGVERGHLKELISGAQFDAQEGPILNESDLMLYCYRVAGVVGLMMCPLIGVRDLRANPHAIDLGLGMQLTNICRDVLEDAQNGRVYLPEDRVGQLGLDLGVLGTKGKTPKQLKELVEDLLNTAEQYYDSGLRGLAFIPLRPRVVILLASQLYRHIGIKLRRKDYEVLQGRVSLNVFEKLLVALKTLPMLIDPRFWTPQKYERSLHLAIQEAPGTNA